MVVSKYIFDFQQVDVLLQHSMIRTSLYLHLNTSRLSTLVYIQQKLFHLESIPHFTKIAAQEYLYFIVNLS